MARVLFCKIILFDRLILYKFVLKTIHLQGGVETFGRLFILSINNYYHYIDLRKNLLLYVNYENFLDKYFKHEP